MFLAVCSSNTAPIAGESSPIEERQLGHLIEESPLKQAERHTKIAEFLGQLNRAPTSSSVGNSWCLVKLKGVLTTVLNREGFLWSFLRSLFYKQIMINHIIREDIEIVHVKYDDDFKLGKTKIKLGQTEFPNVLNSHGWQKPRKLIFRLTLVF